MWGALGCLLLATPAPAALTEAQGLLVDFKAQAALEALDRAEAAGPLAYEAHVTLWEQRGIARAYLGQTDAARSAFTRLLAIAPGHALSYALSPKVTLLFEEVRQRARLQPALTLDVQRPEAPQVGAPTPLRLQRLADPLDLARGGTLYVRARGEPEYRALSFEPTLAPAYTTVTVAAVDGAAPTTLELYAVLVDARGHEVSRWGAPDAPRTLALAYAPPTAWYEDWRLWAVAAAAAAVGAASVIAVGTRTPPRRVGGDFGLEP